jgi:hypothetical protein
MQLNLAEVDGDEQAYLQASKNVNQKASKKKAINNKAINNKASKRPQPQPLKRSSVIHFPMMFQRLTSKKISASSYYPGRGQEEVAPHFPTVLSENEASGDSDSGSTDVESEEEWLSVPASVEPAVRDVSKASHALAIEVRSTSYQHKVSYRFICSVRFGRNLLQPLSRAIPVWYTLMV